MRKKLLAILMMMGIMAGGIAEALPVSAAMREEASQDVSMVEMEGMANSEYVELGGTEQGMTGGSSVWVNPLYPEAAKEAYQEPSSSQSPQAVDATGVNAYSTAASAANYVRKQMVSRRSAIEFYYNGYGLNAVSLRNLQDEILDKVYAVTSSPQEGDYLRYHLTYIRQKYMYTRSGTQAYVVWEVRYTSDAKQEKLMASRIKSVVRSLKLSGCSEAEKIKKIHDYICKNVEYYNDGTWNCHSAYAALKQKAAVCQGYAALFYALGIQAGLKVRCVSGTSNGQPHLWNIVRMGGSWYNLDTTWDDQNSRIIYTYYLKSNGNFPSHTRDAEFQSASFNRKYPMSRNSYTGRVGTLSIKRVKSAGSGKVKITWGKVNTACGYQIYYASGKSRNYQRLGTVKGGAKTAYTATGLKPGKVYYFKVRAYSNLFGETYGKYSAGVKKTVK
jgi:transglutaminase-like putative cysteine protease